MRAAVEHAIAPQDLAKVAEFYRWEADAVRDDLR